MTKKCRMPHRRDFDLHSDQKVSFEVHRMVDRVVWTVVFDPVEWEVERTVYRHAREQLR